MLKQVYRRLQQGVLWVCAWSVSLPVWADLPRPPDSDMASGNNDWIDVGGNLAYKSLRYSCMIVGVMVWLVRPLVFSKRITCLRKNRNSAIFSNMRRSGRGRRRDWRGINLCRLRHSADRLNKRSK